MLLESEYYYRTVILLSSFLFAPQLLATQSSLLMLFVSKGKLNHLFDPKHIHTFERYLVHTGDAMSYLYLVCNGSMEVLQNGSMVVAILGKADLIGYDIPFSLVSEPLIKSSSDVKALTYCDLKSIYVPGLLEVLRMYPEFAETFCTEIIHDLTFNLREGYQNEMDGMHGAHSLILPSISEEEDGGEDEDDADNDDNDESGSGSPPSSPSVGPMVVGGRRGTADWTIRRKSILSGDGVPLLPSRTRPTLRFTQNKAKNNSCPTPKTHSTDRPNLREEVELTRSCMERFDTQMSQMREDMAHLSQEFKHVMSLLQNLCASHGNLNDNQSSLNKASSCREIPQSVDKEGTPAAVTCSSLSQKCSPQPHSLTNSSSCSQLTKGGPNSKGSCLKSVIQTRNSQAERSLLDEYLNKITDCGSPPPNSGYSSSSSNEGKVKILIGKQSQKHAEDSESTSDDSVLRASNSLTIQSMSSREVSPFRGSRSSWTAAQSLADTSFVSPPLLHSSCRPQKSEPQSSSRLNRSLTAESGRQCSIDMEETSSSSQADGQTSQSRSLRKLADV